MPKAATTRMTTSGLEPGGSPRALVDKAKLFELLDYQPHPGQLQIHQSTAARRVVACGVRWGKTTCAAVEGLCAALEPKDRSIGWVVAPTYDLADRVFREIQYFALKSLKHRIVSMKDSERRIVLRNLGGGTSEIRGKSADNPVSLLGEGLDWLVIDEAARLKPMIWQSHLSQRLLDKRGWALLISTPKGKGYFYDLFRAGQRESLEIKSWNWPSWTNPMLDRALIESERTKLPERVFCQEYGAQFVEGAGAVFRNVRELAVGQWQAPNPSESYYAGLDLAKVEDYTVFVIVNKHAEVVFVDRFHRVDWSTQVARIDAASRRYGQPETLVDVTGVGDPVHESLKKAGLFVQPYTFTARSKAAIVDNLVMMFEQAAIKLPTPQLWPEGIDELEAYEFSVSEGGHVRTSAPSGMHDDCVIALALAAWQVRPSREKGGWVISIY